MNSLNHDKALALQYRDHYSLLNYLDENSVLQPVKSKDDWRRRRHVLMAMEEVMGELPGAERQVEFDAKILDEEDTGAFVRCHLTLAVEEGDRLPAYLLLPKHLNKPAPAILCPHQTTPHGKAEPAGLAGLPALYYAAHLAAHGYVTLAVDYPLSPQHCPNSQYSYDWRSNGYKSATMKGIWNHMKAIDYLQSLEEIDEERIGCIGHSLGGHNTLFAGVFDKRIKVLVTSCGFTSFLKNQGGDVSDWSHDGYMPRIAERYQNKGALMPFDFPEVLGALAPRPVFINAPLKDDFDPTGVDDCVRAARQVYALFGASDRIEVVNPDCGHDFPEDVRQAAYAWFDRWL